MGEFSTRLRELKKAATQPISNKLGGSFSVLHHFRLEGGMIPHMRKYSTIWP